jgi:hypothetical protein
MRRDRGRLNGGAITYAPDTLKDGDSYIIAPRAEDYARLRWLPVVDEPPTTPPRTFRRSYLAQWIRGAGKWGAFAAFLADPAAADLAFLWEYCTEFDEDNPSWPAALAAIKTALQLTDAEAEAMLDFGATGGQP